MKNRSEIMARKEFIKEMKSKASFGNLFEGDSGLDPSFFASFVVENSHKTNVSYNESNDEFAANIEVQGTQYEGRSQRIERINVGDTIKLVREPNNQYNSNNIAVHNASGESLGNLGADWCDILAPVIDADIIDGLSAEVADVTPLSKRGGRAKKALLFVKISGKVKNLQIDTAPGKCCTVCFLGGDQLRGWYQELTVCKLNIPTEEIRLIFELLNRASDQYKIFDENTENLNYVGLDYLEQEIIDARAKRVQLMKPDMDYSAKDIETILKEEPDRYSKVKKYFYDDMNNFDDFLLNSVLSEQSVEEKKYYWIDRVRVTESEWDSTTCEGFNHWYEVMELYDGFELPFDLNDEDISCIFGFNKFVEFADLSFGC